MRKTAAGFLGSRFKKTEQWCFHLQLLTIITVTDKFVNPSKILFCIENSKAAPKQCAILIEQPPTADAS